MSKRYFFQTLNKVKFCNILIGVPTFKAIDCLVLCGKGLIFFGKYLSIVLQRDSKGRNLSSNIWENNNFTKIVIRIAHFQPNVSALTKNYWIVI